MIDPRTRMLVVVLGVLAAGTPAWGQDQPQGPGGRRGGGRPGGETQPVPGAPPATGAPTRDDKQEPKTKPVTTQAEVTIGGNRFAYSATAGLMDLPDYDGKTRAHIFYIAYTREPDEGGSPRDPATRPITFAFNGGPGSSSVWLHLGALGPRRVVMGPEGEVVPPPYRLTENEFSWLDFTDLVFIDPVGTGYSRPIEGESARQFYGLDEDIRWVGDFIRLYTTRAHRWSSPKFLAGESYGTTRAAGLSGYLQGTQGMFLNGIVLISPVLHFGTIRFDTGNDLPYWLYLPTYTATAWYHKRLAPELQGDLRGALAEAERWAASEYVLALARGDAMTPGERDRTAAQLARYTGLSKDFCARANLRVEISEFTKELLRDEARTVGRLDSRYKGIDADGVGSRPDYDPSYAAIQGPYTAVLNDYVRRTLGFENDLVYEILTGRVGPWSYGGNENRYANVAETLRSAMSQNPGLHVLIASGYYDLATPYFAADYTRNHLGLDATLRGHIAHAYYECGHMMYVRLPDLEKLRNDVSAFYGRALARP